jgi:hypothetical protein
VLCILYAAFRAPKIWYDPAAMSIFDKFMAFANGLPADQRESVEEGLAALMESLSTKFDFTPAELAEIERRMVEPNPEFSKPADIARIFGKPFRA